jgi:hypothetical protein
MWTVRNNLKGALKFTDIFIGGNPIILKSRGFLDLDLIDGGRQAAEMSEQLKRCYEESYIRDIHRTNTPEEIVQMNLRDLENIAQRSELEDLKCKLQDGGSKMDQILEAINQKADLPGNTSDLMALKDQLESVIDQIQNVSSEEPKNSQGITNVTEAEKKISPKDYSKALEESNHQLRELLKSQDQKIDNLGKMLQNQNHEGSAEGQPSDLITSVLETQTLRVNALMDKLQQQQIDKEKSQSKIKLEESEFDFNGEFVAFDNSLSEINDQLREIKDLKALLEKQKQQLDSQEIETPEQIQEQKQQLNTLMEMIQRQESSVLSKEEIAALVQQNPDLGKQDELINNKLDQISQRLDQKDKAEQAIQSSNNQKLEKQLDQQKEQIDQLTALLTQKSTPQDNPNSALEQQLAQQQEQIKQLTDLLIKEKVQEKQPAVEKSQPDQDLMQKNLALQHEQLMNISNTINEIKEKDEARHDDMIDLKVLMAQHQSGNTFSRVVKTLSATDIEAALKVSDQIDDRIKDKQFEVTKKTKQKTDRPDVSELLGNTDLDFD